MSQRSIIWIDSSQQQMAHKKDGKFHRVDGPAIVLKNGDTSWWVDGFKHRVDGPAVMLKNGNKEWWVHGKRHRVDGPAIENTDGHDEWYQNGTYHRVGGPAVTNNRSNQWWVNGERHRLDGPAIEWAGGNGEWSTVGKMWYLFDTSVTKEEHANFCKLFLQHFSEHDMKDVPYHVLRSIYHELFPTKTRER